VRRWHSVDSLRGAACLPFACYSVRLDGCRTLPRFGGIPLDAFGTYCWLFLAILDLVHWFALFYSYFGSFCLTCAMRAKPGEYRLPLPATPLLPTLPARPVVPLCLLGGDVTSSATPLALNTCLFRYGFPVAGGEHCMTCKFFILVWTAPLPGGAWAEGLVPT